VPLRHIGITPRQRAANRTLALGTSPQVPPPVGTGSPRVLPNPLDPRRHLAKRTRAKRLRTSPDVLGE